MKGEINMIFIIEDKKYNAETAEKILEFSRKYPKKMLTGHTIYIIRDTVLYRTQKGNWFTVAKGDYNSFTAYKENEEDVKRLFKALNDVEKYSKYFRELEEA